MGIPQGDGSASSLRSYLQCPKREVEARRKGVRSAPPAFVQAGAVWHQVINRITRKRLAAAGMLNDHPLAATKRTIHVPHPALSTPLTADEIKAEFPPGLKDEAVSRGDVSLEVAKIARANLMSAGTQVDLRLAVASEWGWRLELPMGRTVVGGDDRIDIEDGTRRYYSRDGLVPAGAVTIWDYKSGEGRAPHHSELEIDLQACFYVVVAKHYWPHAPAHRVVLDHVQRGERAELVWTPEIDSDTRILAAALVDKRAKGPHHPRVGVHCGDCPIRATCHAYKETLAGDATTPTLNPASPIDDLVREQRKFDVQAKLAADRASELTKWITAQMGNNFKVVAGGQRVVIHQNENRDADAEVLVPELAKALNVAETEVLKHVAEIGFGRLDKWVATFGEAEQKKAETVFLKHVRTFGGTPYLRYYPVKGPF